MPRAVFTNNARTTLSAGINNSVTSISVTDGSVFPSPTGGDWAYLTIESGADIEIVQLTARSGNTLTVVRAQDGTTAKSFSSGASISLRLTKAALDEIHTELAGKALSTHTHTLSQISDMSANARTFNAAADYAAMRTALGLGTAAVLNTGTSGATIPRNDTANTWSALQTFSGVANTSEVIRVSNTADGRRVHIYPIRVGSQNGDLNIDAMDGHSINFQTSSSTKATLSSSALTVSVPTTISASGQALTVQGATDPYIMVIDTSNPTQVFLQATNGIGLVGTNTNHPLGFYTNATQRGEVTAAGQLSWGTGGFTSAGFTSVTGSSFLQIYTSSPLLDIIRSSGATDPSVQLRTGARYDRIMNTTSGLWFGVNYSGTEKTMLLTPTGELILEDFGPTSTLAAGYRGAPRNRQDSSYTLVLADAGKSIVGYGSTTSQTWTIPANSSVAYPIGTTIVFCNMRSVACSIAITSDTLYQAGTGATGTRTLAAYSMATAIKVDTTNWLISGAGLS